MQVIESLQTGQLCGLKLSNNLINESQTHYQQIVNIPSLEVKKQKKLSWYDRLEKIIRIAKNKDLLSNAIVHGSYGDFSYTNFSDLEITLLIKQHVLENKKVASVFARWLRRDLNPLIFNVDPLQHHGPFYLWSDLITNYSEKILPISAYQNCWAVFPISVEFSIIDANNSYRVKPILSTVENIRNYYTAFFKLGKTPYAIKRLLSNIMILPVYLMQYKGINISKKEAIKQISRHAPLRIIEMINSASALRKNWPDPPKYLGLFRSAINSGSIPSGHMDLLFTSLYRNKSLQVSFNHEILPKINGFCDVIEQMIDKNVYL